MLGSFKVVILQKGTFNIEIPDLLCHLCQYSELIGGDGLVVAIEVPERYAPCMGVGWWETCSRGIGVRKVLHERDSMTGKKVVTFTALLNCKFGVLDSALGPGTTKSLTL